MLEQGLEDGYSQPMVRCLGWLWELKACIPAADSPTGANLQLIDHLNDCICFLFELCVLEACRTLNFRSIGLGLSCLRGF